MTESETIISAVPTSDERLLAALAHGSVLLSFLGPIGPLLVWVSQRRKSPYAAFHALQAMGYQMAFFWIGMAVGLLLAIFWMLLFFPIMLSTLQNDPENFLAPLAFEAGFIILMVSIWGIYFIGGILGALMCLLKKDVRYPWIGKRLEAYLRFDSAAGVMEEAMQERFVAAMSHASAILLIWGLLSPLAVWVTQKDRSPYLRFQGLQAALYQALAILGYVAFMAVYVASILAFALVMPFLGLSGNPPEGLILILVLIFSIVILLVWIVFLLALPTYHLFAMIAGIRILKGGDYRYPLLGNFLARRMKLDELKKEG